MHRCTPQKDHPIIPVRQVATTYPPRFRRIIAMAAKMQQAVADAKTCAWAVDTMATRRAGAVEGRAQGADLGPKKQVGRVFDEGGLEIYCNICTYIWYL